MKKIRVRYACPKCGNNEFELGRVYAPGSRLMKILNFENRSFSSVTCTKCFYTELYKLPKEHIQNALELIASKQSF